MLFFCVFNIVLGLWSYILTHKAISKREKIYGRLISIGFFLISFVALILIKHEYSNFY